MHQNKQWKSSKIKYLSFNRSQTWYQGHYNGDWIANVIDKSMERFICAKDDVVTYRVKLIWHLTWLAEDKISLEPDSDGNVKKNNRADLNFESPKPEKDGNVKENQRADLISLKEQIQL